MSLKATIWKISKTFPTLSKDSPNKKTQITERLNKFQQLTQRKKSRIQKSLTNRSMGVSFSTRDLQTLQLTVPFKIYRRN